MELIIDSKLILKIKNNVVWLFQESIPLKPNFDIKLSEQFVDPFMMDKIVNDIIGKVIDYNNLNGNKYKDMLFLVNTPLNKLYKDKLREENIKKILNNE